MMVAIEYGSMPNPTVHYMVPRTGKVIALRSGHFGLLTHPHQKSNRQGLTHGPFRRVDVRPLSSQLVTTFVLNEASVYLSLAPL